MGQHSERNLEKAVGDVFPKYFATASSTGSELRQSCQTAETIQR